MDNEHTRLGGNLGINAVICGMTSVGKSTFLNALCKRQYAETGIKPTTMKPHLYSTNETNKIDLNKEELIIRHQIDPISDLINNPNIIINIIDLPGLSYKNIDWMIKNIKSFNVIIFMTDISRGLRDQEEVDHIEKIINEIAGTNTKIICIINKCDDIFYDSEKCELIFEEKEIQYIFIQSNQILENIVKKYNCSDNVTSFLPACAENEFIYRMLHSGRINELDSYYHIRLCKNECGSNSWKNMTPEEKNTVSDHILAQTEHIFGNTITFDNVNQHMKKIINENLETFVAENIFHQETVLKSVPHLNNEEYIALINEVEKLHQQFSVLFHKNIRSSMLKNIECHIEERIRDVINQDVRIVRTGYYIRFNLFKQIMDKIQKVYIDFVELANFIKDHFNDKNEFIVEDQLLTESLSTHFEAVAENRSSLTLPLLRDESVEAINVSPTLPLLRDEPIVNAINAFPTLPLLRDEYQTYTERFLIEHEKVLRDKNIFIFDQILLLNVTQTEYTYPINFLEYLKFIQKNIPDKFDYYAIRYLEIICKNIKLVYTENIKRDCLNLVNFINEYGKSKNILLKQIYKILINRHYQVNHEGYENTFYYHVNLKHKINAMVMHKELSIDDGMLCLIMEIIEKSISMMIGVGGIKGLYNQEIDYGKVNILLDSAVQYNLLADVNLENGLLKVIADIHKNIFFNS